MVQVGEGQHLSLPRRHKRRVVSTFGEWSRCFTVYASTLCAYQPLRGPDMLAYLYLLAAAQQEFNLPACLAYDVAFRRKAARFHLSTWGQLDPQLYAKAFTGVGTSSSCALCLEATHSTAECSLYSAGPANKPRATPAGPKHSGLSSSGGKEICYNFNKGRCSARGCPRAHICSFTGCGAPHPASRCMPTPPLLAAEDLTPHTPPTCTHLPHAHTPLHGRQLTCHLERTGSTRPVVSWLTWRVAVPMHRPRAPGAWQSSPTSSGLLGLPNRLGPAKTK